VNRGKGQPQVVNDKNYVKHSRDGKIIGAMLSRIGKYNSHANAEKARKAANKKAAYKLGEPQMNASKAFGWTKESVKEMRNPAGPYGGHPYDWDPVLRKQIMDAAAKKVKKLPGSPQPSKLDTGRAYKPTYNPPPRRGTANESIIGGVIGLAMGAAGAYGAAKNTALPTMANGGKNSRFKHFAKDYAKNYIKGMVGIGLHDKKPGTSTGMPATGRPGTAVKKNAMGGYHAKNKKGEERKFADKGEAGKWLKSEDSRDVEAIRQRIAKTKHNKKKKVLKELHNATLTSYVSKAIANRKQNQSAQSSAASTVAPKYFRSYVNDKQKVIDKRSKGIKTAVGKIAGKLPGEKVNEVSAPGKEDWIKSNKARFIERYGKEKGLRVLYAKAWKDSKTNEARENEYTANQQLAQTTKPTQKGHYLMRDGRKLSGPHSPEDAVKAYKNMSVAGKGDTKGVKIVHVKEAKSIWSDEEHKRMDANHKRNKAIVVAHHKKMLEKGYKYTHSDGRNTPFDGYDTEHHYTSPNGKHKKIMSYSAYALGYDNKLKPEYRKEKLNTNHPDLKEATELHADLVEASEQKVKDAAQKAIKLAKAKKKGKTANTEPELKLPDGSTNSPSPVEANDGVSNHV
jgi:hypothetical protein